MKSFASIKRTMIALLTASAICAPLSGCEYSSIDEYLEALGMKDPDYGQEYSTADTTFVITEDVPAVAATETTEEIVIESISEASAIEDVAALEDSVPADSESPTSAADSKYSSSYKTSREAVSDSEMQAAREAIGLTSDNIASIKKKQEGLYAYQRLTDEGKTLYVELLTIMENQASDILISTTSDEAVELVFDYVMTDHPEIFYVDGYQYTNYTVDDVIKKISFTGNYIYNKDEIADRQSKINDAVNKCLANAPSSEDDYYVIKYIYDYLIENTDYDINNPDNQNICSVFIDGRSVCNGYAKAAQYLLNKLGIECSLVTGTVDTKQAKGVRHAWNLVLCNNAYYYVDVTWGDSSYQTTNGESADASKLPAVNYDYLNVTTSELCTNHTISDIIDMPICNSMTDNYYVREDEYFKSSESALIKDLFNRRYNDGSSNVTIKCATKEVYDEIFDQLITQRGVFDMLQGDTSTVSYTTFADTRTIIFWL